MSSRNLLASRDGPAMEEESTARGSVRSISPEKRENIRKETEQIYMKNLMMREETKKHMFEKRLQHEHLLQYSREERDRRWKAKTKHSPFAVNLVAEDERITEENTIRLQEENDRRHKLNARKEKAKNEIVLKALSEFSDLEALRKEKRAILEEEQRLKALLSLEKVTVTGKADRLIAERAQRQRRDAKLAQRRTMYKDSLDQVMEEERAALMKKHAMSSASLSGSLSRGGTSHSRVSTHHSAASAPLSAAAMAAMSGSGHF